MVDSLVRQLETQNNEGFQQPFDIERAPTTETGLLTLTDQEGFMRLLDELDVDVGSGSSDGDVEMATDGQDQSSPDSWEEPGVTIVDEHDYAKGARYSRVPISASYSSTDDGCQSGSESQSRSPFSKC